MRRAALLVVCLLAAVLVLSQFCVAQAAPAAAAPVQAQANAGQPERPRIGLALGGGGALGLAHVGVLKWFEEHHIPVDAISGTSMGALIGGLYATGRSAADIQTIADSNVFSSVFVLQRDYTDLSYRRRQDRRDLPQAITVGLKNGIRVRSSLLTEVGVNEFLSDVFLTYSDPTIKFDDLPIPYRCVATDLTASQTVEFSSGTLPSAVRASISLPGIFPPVERNGHYLVDGSVLENLPVARLQGEMHAQVVIAVSFPESKIESSDLTSIFNVLLRSFSVAIEGNEARSRKLADVLISPQTQQFTTNDYDKAQQLLAVGYKAAEEQRAKLLPYALSDADWQAYLAHKNARKRLPPGLLKTVRVEGGSSDAQREVKTSFAKLQNKPIEQDSIHAALDPVQSDEAYSASFRTFTSHPQSTGIQASADGVLVRLKESPLGPPFLLIGGDMTAMTDSVTRMAFDMRLINQNFGGYGSELRSSVRLGFLTQANTEYYRLLNTNGLFVQPRLGVLRQPVYIFQNQKRTTERLEQDAGGEIDFGRTISKRSQLSLQWRESAVRWETTSGSDGQPDLSGTAQTALMHFTFSNQDDVPAARHGLSFSTYVGSIYNAVGSRNAPEATFAAAYVQPIGSRNSLALNASADTYFRRNVADPFRFTLGGPLRLSASSVDEYRGTDDYFARAAFLHPLGSMPAAVGKGIFAVGAYEAGEVWSPSNPAFLRQDVSLGAQADTILGAVTFGVSVGDAGHRKVFFTFGRLF